MRFFLNTLMRTKKRMPCGCLLDKPSYPQNEEWGSILWRVFHTLAELSGRQSHPMMKADEMRAWPLLIKAIPAVLPCPFCKDHLLEWLKAKPFEPGDYSQWNSYIRTWFYDLHENVNQRLGKPTHPFHSLSQTYTETFRIKVSIQQFELVAKRAIKMDGLSILSFNTWNKQIKMLCSVYGI